MNPTSGATAMKQFTTRYAWPLWRWYLAGFIALAATNLVTLEIPQLAKEIVNSIESSAAQATLAQPNGSVNLANIALLIMALGVLQILIRSLSRILVFWPGRTIEATCRNDAFDHLLALPQQALEKFGMGDLISRLANDIGQLRVFYAFRLLQILNLTFLSLFIITRMLSIHTGLTLACMAPLSLMLFITKFAMPKMQHYSKLNQEATGNLTNKVTEAFVNVHVVQQTGAESTFINRTKDENEAVYSSNMKLVVLRNAVFPLMSALASVGQMMVIFYGGYEVIHQRLTVGDILAFNVYIGFLSFPLTAFGMIIAMYERAKTAVIRLQEIESQKSENHVKTGFPIIGQDTLTARPMTRRQAGHEGREVYGSFSDSGDREVQTKPLISVKNLCFSYETPSVHTPKQESNGEATSENRPFRLHDISFDLHSGQRLGICGAIGSGKTTLLQLLVHLYNPPSGTIFLDGEDINNLPPTKIRQTLAMATQSVHLFSASIEDNLKFGVPEATFDQVQKAAREAYILDEILNLPQGFETGVGEKGIRLSGGQKQRLALARLFLRDPQVMLLDDVFSAVDQLTETHLIRNLIDRGCGMIVASHRPSVLKCCDKIIVLEKGKIKASGSWKDVAQHIGANT